MSLDATQPGAATAGARGGHRDRHWSLVILGSGPAGLTAAIYAARASLRPLVIAGDRPLGQVALSAEIEDYPGFAEPIAGTELMETMRSQAERFGATLLDEDAIRVSVAERPFRVATVSGEHHADALIVATGASAVPLGIPSEGEFRGRGVSDCAACDAFFFRGRRVAVVGAGDTALEEASVLTRFVEEIVLIVPDLKLRGSKTIEKRLLDDPKVRVVWNCEVTDVVGNGAVAGVQVRDRTSGETMRIDVQGLFVALGYRPNAGVLRGQLRTSNEGYLEPCAPDGTQIKGLFLAGDVHDHRYRQAVAAAGDGCRAAIDAEQWLASIGQAEIATATNW